MKSVKDQSHKAQPKTIKTYVTVSAIFNLDGKLTPEYIRWRDGRIFRIEKIIGVENYTKDSIINMDVMYTCSILGKVCHLYFENWSKWFVEEKVAA